MNGKAILSHHIILLYFTGSIDTLTSIEPVRVWDYRDYVMVTSAKIYVQWIHCFLWIMAIFKTYSMEFSFLIKQCDSTNTFTGYPLCIYYCAHGPSHHVHCYLYLDRVCMCEVVFRNSLGLFLLFRTYLGPLLLDLLMTSGNSTLWQGLILTPRSFYLLVIESTLQHNKPKTSP